MKIHNKTTFQWGSLILGCAVALAVLRIVTGRADFYGMATCILIGILGVINLVRALSRDLARKDMVEERDERNHMLRLQARTKALFLSEVLILISTIIIFLLVRIPGNEHFVHLGMGCFLALFIIMFTEAVILFYYERKE